MAIRPPSDIVLDVARAADPMRYEQAKLKLHEISTAGGASFDDVFGEVVRQPSRRQMRFDQATAMMHFRNTAALNQTSCSARGNVDPRKAAAYEAFEAMTLKTVVETMLPSNSEAVFGKGFAGGVWKSLMAEQVAAQMARSGGIGIAERLLAADRGNDETSVPRTVDALADDIAGAGERRAAATEAKPATAAATLPPIETLPPASTDQDTLL